jgi:hypothetical protein
VERCRNAPDGSIAEHDAHQKSTAMTSSISTPKRGRIGSKSLLAAGAVTGSVEGFRG